jgi:membrane protein involved in colicin uptake
MMLFSIGFEEGVFSMATVAVRDRANQRHSHKANGAGPATERCPWCGSKISRTEFDRIRNEIAEQERARVAKIEKALNERFTGELRAAKLEAAEITERQIKARVQAERSAAAKKIAQATGAARAAEQQIKRFRANQDAVIKARLDAEREAGAKKLAEAVSAEKIKVRIPAMSPGHSAIMSPDAPT